MRRFLPIVILASSVLLTPPTLAYAQIAVGVSITIAPPALVVYAQPPIPAPGYIWTPGYWAWGVEGYYWVPGTWVQPPTVGVLWTPGYWGWSGGVYVFNPGYWGPHIGFYGGINYGFGYGGSGYEGGYWNNGVFNYNRSVNNISNVHITNVYNKTVINNTLANSASFNGGNGGTTARPTPAQLAVAHEPHVPPTAAQTQHVQAASSNRQLLASVNHGRPAIAATARPADFSHDVVAPRAAVSPAAARPAMPPAEHAVPGAHPPAAAAVPHAAEPRPNAAVASPPRAAPAANRPAQPAARPAPPHVAARPAAAPAPRPAPSRAPSREEKR